ncbi:hypothetical protein HPB50_005479 [Hyalomma asiaticum]|uniref:Uncharacterized protein n=1 Tax=Hyalomma asiaticum TaxID=266040 RepID=A0ACB7SBB0_HYAAI|nr:hypothetical protein HPB50_005479 [Hyalomma asiaticum]
MTTSQKWYSVKQTFIHTQKVSQVALSGASAGREECLLRFVQANYEIVNLGGTEAEQAFEQEARRGMNADEASFSVESPLQDKTYLWSDKYRPRKPRYFNRVHTGFEWNKYNQTHYDMDNPPPKIVQGYKFNVRLHVVLWWYHLVEI